MSATPISTHPDTATHTRIQQPELVRILRAAWIVIAMVAVGLYFINFATLIYIRQTICVENCTFYQITPEDLQNYAALGLPYAFRALYIPLLDLAAMLIYLVTGLFIFLRRSNDWMAMVCSLALVTLGTTLRFVLMVLPSIDPAWGWTFIPMLTITLGLVYVFFYTFPDGKLVPRWALFIVIPSIIWEATRATIITFVPKAPGNQLFLVTLSLMLLAIGCRIYRYRYVSTPAQRQQTKWVLVGISITLLGVLADTLISLFIESNPALLASPNGTLYILVISPTIVYGTGVVAAIAIGFSVLRYRIWDVDLILNRSLTLGLVTLLLALVFAAGAYMLQLIIGATNSGAAFAISAVGAGMLFQPARRAARNFIDRRIYRLNFDLNQLYAAQKIPEIKTPGAHTGKILGGYQLLGLIGRGGMGEIYQGIKDGHTAAVKILPPELAQKAEFRQRFEREARALTTLDHPNIVKIFESGQSEDGIAYVVMEEIPGIDLGDYLKQQQGALPADTAQIILKDLAAALDYAHQKGLVHRDIKPSNVMLSHAGDGETLRAVLMDFGIAKMGDGRTAITGTDPIGTIDYMAPEQIMAAKTVDHRADIYALGVVAYQMLTGELPFKGSAAQVLFAHIQQPPSNPRDVNPDVPRPVAKAVLKALSKPPDDRFQTAGEMLQSMG